MSIVWELRLYDNDGARVATFDTWPALQVEVGVPAVTVVETSEYVQTVTINCDVTGTGPIDPIVTLFVRIEWGTFVSAPVVAVA